MDDKHFFSILDEISDIQYLIVVSGGMATKSLVEKVLIERHKELSNGDARTFTNYAEGQPRSFIIGRKVTWIAKRPEPKIENYSELGEYLCV